MTYENFLSPCATIRKEYIMTSFSVDSCNSGFTIFHINQYDGPNECVIKSLTKHGKSYYKMHSHMLLFHWKGMVLLISNSKYKTQSKGNET